MRTPVRIGVIAMVTNMVLNVLFCIAVALLLANRSCGPCVGYFSVSFFKCHSVVLVFA